ncbi:MAG: choice-of-anchor D domain-containing protein, partial [Gammaproteobacteria bacterium]
MPQLSAVSTLRPLSLAIAAALLHQPASADVITWAVDANGFWDVASNWSSSPVLPGAADDARLNLLSPTLRTITFRSGDVTVASLESAHNFAMTGGVLRLNGASRVDAAFTQSGGTLTGPGDLTLFGPTSFSSTTHSGGGRTILNGATTMNVGINLNAGRILDNRATLTWSGGTIELNSVSGDGAGRLDNAAGALIDVLGNNAVRATGFSDIGLIADMGRVNNAGTFRKSVGAGTTTIEVSFNNSGQVQVQSGTLDFTGGGTGSGSYSGNGTLRFGGGTHTLGTGTISVGTLLFGNATLTHAGTIDVSGSTSVTAGDHTLSGSITSLGSTLTVGGGVLRLGSSNVNVETLNMNGGTLVSSGELVVSQTAAFTGGVQSGPGLTVVEDTATATINGGLGLDAGRILENRSTLTWNSGSIDLNATSTGGSGRLDNAVGAVFNAGANGTLRATTFGDIGALPDMGRVNNFGTFRKTGAGTVTVDALFNNVGTVDLLSGNLELNSGSSVTGDISGAGTLRFGGGTHILGATADVSVGNLQLGGGTLTHAGSMNVTGTTSLSGGSHTLNGTVTSLGSTLISSSGVLTVNAPGASVSTLTMTGGTIGGSFDLTVSGSASFAGGTLTGAGDTVLQGPSSVTSGFGIDAGRVVENRDTMTWSGGNIELNATSTGGAGRLDNAVGALILATGNNTLRSISFSDRGLLPNTDRVNNLGTFRKDGGSGSTIVDVAFNNDGAVEVLTGTLEFNSGGASAGDFSGPGTLHFGGGTHTLSATADIDIGNIIFGGGTLEHAGTLNVANSTTLSGGTHNLSGAVASLGTILNATGGRLNLNALDIGVATLNMSSGGTIGGTGNFVVSGDATIAGGGFTDTGRTRLNGASSVTGFNLDAGRVVENRGEMTWTAGTIALNSTSSGGSGRFENAAGALFEARGNNTISLTNFSDRDLLPDMGRFDNAGTFRKAVGTGTTTVDAAFNNSGSVEVQTGLLDLGGGGNQSASATFDISTGATLRLGGNHAFANFAGITSAGRLLVSSGGTQGSGALTLGGVLEIAGGALILADDGVAQNYTQSSGTLDGAGDLTVNGAALLSGGRMSGTGVTVLANGGDLSGIGLDAGRTLESRGTVRWLGGTLQLNESSTGGAGRFVNAEGALFDAQNNNSVAATNFADINDLPGTGVFLNQGTFRKSAGAGVTTLSAAFANEGALEVNSGTVELTGGSTHAVGSTIVIASGRTLRFGTGTHVLDDLAGVINAGTMVVSGGSTTGSGALDSAGLLEISGGTLTLNDDSTTVNFTQSGGTLAGAGDLSITGQATITSGVMTGAGSTVLLGTGTLQGTSLDAGRILDNRGTLTWTAGNIGLNNSANGGAGRVDNAAGALFDIQGNNSVTVTNFSDRTLLPDMGVVNNAGMLRKSAGAGTSLFQSGFNNLGSTEVSIGTLDFNDQVAQHVGTTLTGGTWRVSGSGTLNFSRSGAQNIVTNQGDVTLDGAAASFARINTLTDNQGAFRLLGARNFTAVGAFNNSGVLQLGGGAFGAPSLTNNVVGQRIGEIFGFGTVTPTVLNHGLVRAAGGVLTMTGGIDGQSGTIQVDEGATLVLGADSDGDFLINNGTLALGTSNVTVVADYTNGGFGVGNAFNARANVTGSGQILAAGDVAQALSGDVVNGAGAAPQMAFGNIHVGDQVTRSFAVSNTGSNGPALRGALQTSVNGGNLTDARLTGSGVTADNYGPVAAGASSAAFDVTFTGGIAGALSGQSVAVVNNFDNVAEQVLSISGAVFRYANPTAHVPEPVVFANRRVGDSASQLLSLTNDVPNDGFSESLDASIGGATGNATTNGGSFSLLTAGATNSTALEVGIDTSSAGHKVGTATITLTSNGAGTSELGTTALGTQTVNVSGDVYRLASPSAHSPEPVVFANRHVGAAATQALSLTNTAANDGFSERLNATIGGATGNVSTNGGSFSLLGAGQTDASSLTVSLDTSTAGAKSGTATISLASDGTGTSGFGALELDPQTVNVSGNVYRFAEGSAHSPEPIVFANRHVGSAASQALSLSNLATADGFSESLDASIGGATGNATTNGGSFSLLAAGASNVTALAVGIDTSSAGAKSGTATITLSSNGAGTSELGTTALGTQTVNVSGNVYRFAEAGTVAAVEFGNVHVGDVVSRTLTLSNIAAADGFSESLDAVFDGVSDTRILTSGGVSGLAAGATDNSSLVVGLDTSTAGSLTGFATLNFTSNGAGTSGLGTTSLGSQNVGVTTNVAVYRFAEGAVDTAQPVDFGAFRVGDAAGTQGVTVRNAAVNDGFSESLDVSVASVDAGFTASGSVSGLAAGASNGSGINVGLDTSVSGVKTGQATLDYVSNGTGTSDLGQTAVGNEAVALTGRVYAQAVASVETVGIDFGIVHVGDVIGAQGVTVRNIAAGTLTDNLLGSISAVPAGFVGNGTLGATGLAQGEASSALSVGLSTSAAGVFSGEASLSFASHNAEMADLVLAGQGVSLTAQVNNFANAVLDKAGGDGTFAQVNVGQYVFDFGTLTAGGNIAGLLSLANVSPGGPTDVLGADFDIGG